MNKYRAWDKEKKRMLDVAVLEFNRNTAQASGIQHWIGENTLEHIHANKVNLMQSTGLKDKNGVEIFEGDVVINKTKRVITYGEQKYDGVVDYIGFNVFVKWNQQSKNQVEYEVIGNIHANPELLKEVE